MRLGGPVPFKPYEPYAIVAGDQRYLNRVFADVTLSPGVEYGRAANQDGSQSRLLLDVYQPAGDLAALRPAVILIHGGGMSSGSRDAGAAAELSADLARRGYVCFSIDYRLGAAVPGMSWAQTIRDGIADTLAASAWVRAHAGEYRVDPRHLAIGGESAGGALALNAAYSGQLGPDKRSNYFAVINIYGSTLGYFDAVHYDLDSANVPVLTVQGDHDNLMPMSSSLALTERLERRGIPTSLFVMKGEGHNASGRYREQVAQQASQFLYRFLTGDRTPLFLPLDEPILASPGETLHLTLRRNPLASDGAVTVVPIAADGWRISGQTLVPAGAEAWNFTLTVPLQAAIQGTFIIFDTTTGASAQPGRGWIRVQVRHPLSVGLDPDLAAADRWTCTVSNESGQATPGGSLLLSETSEAGAPPVRLDLAPLPAKGRQVFTIQRAAWGQIRGRLVLDSGYRAKLPVAITRHLIHRNRTPVAIDGDLGDWPDKPLFRLGQAQDIVLQLKGWDGPEFLSADCWLGWDQDCLYLAADVASRDFNQTGSGSGIWMGDSLQLGIDTRAVQEPTGAGYTELGLAYSTASRRTESWLWITPGAPGAAEEAGIRSAVRRQGASTRYEAAIPWPSLTPDSAEIKTGSAIRFALAINHAGPDGMRGAMEFGSGIVNAKDATQFCQAILAD